jgi:hypothetical protein
MLGRLAHISQGLVKFCAIEVPKLLSRTQQFRKFREGGVGAVERIGVVGEARPLAGGWATAGSGGISLHGEWSGCQRATERCQPSARHPVQLVSGEVRVPRLNQR